MWRAFVRALLLLTILIGIGVGAWWLKQVTVSTDIPETQVIEFSDRSQKVALQAVIVQASETDQRLLICKQRTCQPLSVAGVSDEYATDGEWAYYYTTAVSEKTKLEKRILQRTSLSRRTTEQITEATPLTSPQGLFMSPDGTKLAFFLDNVDKPKDQLTELWIYDVQKGASSLVAEKLYTPDIRSRVQWNRASSLLWFIADTGEQKNPKDVLQLVVAPLQSPQAAVAFTRHDWGKLQGVAQDGAMDINQTGTDLAYVTRSIFGGTTLVTASAEAEQRVSVPGSSVQYLEWLSSDTLLYVAQDPQGFTFWQQQRGINRHLARRPGVFRSAHSEAVGEFVLFVAEEAGKAQLYALHLDTGSVTSEGTLPAFGKETRIVLASQEAVEQSGISNITKTLEDSELVAVVEKNLKEITGVETARATRLLMTQEDNTLFIDYEAEDGQVARVLVTIRDAVNTEWSIRARYVAAGAEWQKLQGGTTEEPAPARLYEWEPSLAQWILKTTY